MLYLFCKACNAVKHCKTPFLFYKLCKTRQLAESSQRAGMLNWHNTGHSYAIVSCGRALARSAAGLQAAKLQPQQHLVQDRVHMPCRHVGTSVLQHCQSAACAACYMPSQIKVWWQNQTIRCARTVPTSFVGSCLSVSARVCCSAQIWVLILICINFCCGCGTCCASSRLPWSLEGCSRSE